MKILKTIALAAVLASGALFAVLPPEAQMEKEIASIEKHEEFAKFAELEPGKTPTILKIEDGYLVELENHRMHVHVQYLPNSKPCCGPAQYQLLFDTPELTEAVQ